ncbi:MAG: glutamate synthase large subunit [Deltaproteobacteria bacterium]|nr:MAG: glutamate synthase large subunit [Deltaproteobacteria bacterium]
MAGPVRRVAPGRYGLYDPSTERDACGIGFVAHIKGEKSRSIVDQALELLRRLSHRAACGWDPNTGDGAGILLQLPHRFFKAKGLELGFDMPRRRRYGVGMLFLPADAGARARCEQIVEEVVAEEGQRVIGWRDVPVDPAHVGAIARDVMPVVRQVYIARRRLPPSAFERKLFIIRKLVENRVRERGVDPDGRFHVASMSAETIVYKGMLLPSQLPRFYPDLQHADMVSAIAVVHSRFSTNTFPTWDLAQPFRYICHNGEINTLRGNRNWMMARRSQLQSAKFGGRLDRLQPIIVPGKSDSAQFDNMLELLYLGGRSLPHAMMMMIPEAWENDPLLDEERKHFYQYAESLVEPWDGPAAIAFTDGEIVGATLDRNGLRPARYLITEDDRVVLASETGVIDVPPEQIRYKGRLQPGKMLVIDTAEGRIIDDDEVKREITQRWPYGKWLAKNVYDIDRDPSQYTGYNLPPFPDVPAAPRMSGDELLRQQRAFGFTDEDERLIVLPMARDGKEPTGSMGNDTPLAVLSDRAPTLPNYFHQLFAQVTNPPIDPIRERLVMTLATAIGPDGNTFDETPEQCHRIVMDGPILTNEKLAKIASIREGVFEPIKLSMLYPVADGPDGLARAVDRLCDEAREAIDDGYNVLILSDRGVDAKHAPIPALLAVSAVHHHLVREGTRMQTGLILETGEAREVHDFAVLLGFGVAAINPYVALDTVKELVATGRLPFDVAEAKRRYIKAVCDGLLKVMSKMGISTLQSYRGAQIFECVGLNRDLIDRHFPGTPSRIEGIGLRELGREVLERHDRAFGAQAIAIGDTLPVGGQYQWRRRGEVHKWNPATIAKLQAAARANDPALFAEYAALVDDEDRALCTIRGMLDFATDGVDPIPIDEVEPAADIVKRFCTGAMSFGSISPEAHETLAIAMNRIGGRSNSGEGGEESHRYERDDNGDWRSSRIKQVASARFGVTAHYLVNADDLQIKIAQGAKPGEGGQLPGHKVDERIAKVRHSTPGVTLISPPPHHDIYSIEDLAQLIFDLQAINPSARVSVKLVSEVGVGTIAAGVAKAHAGAIVIAGASGGTGASPISSIKHAGLPWELGLAETQQVLVQNNLRGRVRLQADGGMRTGRDLAIAALLGAEEWGVATAALIVEGCIMLRKCHLNTCSVGVATQDERLRARFRGRVDDVVHFFFLMAEHLRSIMARLGFRTVDDMVGRVDRLRARDDLDHWKARTVDLSAVLAQPDAPAEWPRRFVEAVPWDLSGHRDRAIVARAQDAIDGRGRIVVDLPVANTDRAVGTLLSGDIARRHGEKGLVDDSIRVRLSGSAGQSFGAFLANGVTLELAGDANDYVGKGLSGGRIIVKPPPGSRFDPADNIIIGNVALYGATSGELFVNGLAGERFAVRNSGARAVVEGVGDHGCEYMTGGVVVVLGPTGRNFAAGMSGGMAFVFDRDRSFRDKCNLGMVELESLVDESDLWLVYHLIEDHVRHTGSPLGQRVIDNWEHLVSQFVKVMPTEYKRVLQARRAALRPKRPAPQLAIVDGGRS